MTGFLDTSIVIRYLTGDSPDLARHAAQIIDNEAGLLITDVALADAKTSRHRDVKASRHPSRNIKQDAWMPGHSGIWTPTYRGAWSRCD